MRRGWLLAACLGLFLITGHVFAIGEPIRSVEDVASIIPDDTAFYFVMRTDDQVIEDIDALINRATDKLGFLGMSSVSVEDEIRRSLDEMGVEYEDLRAAVGDYMAFSVTADGLEDLIMGNDAVPRGFRLYVQVADPEAMRDIVEMGNPDSQTRDGYTLYDLRTMTLAYSPEWVIAMNEPRLPTVGDSLAKAPGYQDVVAQLAGDDYGALMYLSPEALSWTVEGVPSELRELTEQHAAIAFSLEDKQHMVMDFVQTLPDDSAIVSALPTTPIDSEFLRYVPEDADLVVQLTDMAGYFDYMDLYMGSFLPGFNLRRDFERELSLLNLDLDEDVLSWMDGNTLLYTTIDLETLVESNGQLTEMPFEFALVLEAQDPKAPQRLLDFLTRELKNSGSPDMRVTTSTLNDVDVTVIRFEIPNGLDPIIYDVFMGVTDEVAFIATRDATRFITSGRGRSLLESNDYREAAELYLPDTKQVFYASDEGVITVGSVLAALAFLGSGMDMDMPLPGFPNLEAASPYVAYQPGSTSFFLDMARNVLHSASITSTIGGGFQVTRLVFSLE